MARIVVIGGGVGGLVSGILLARDGHDVKVLERDAGAPPATADEAWSGWERRGVNQFRMIHMFLPRFRQLLETELPDAAAGAEEWGAIRFNPMRPVPAQMIGGFSRPPRPVQTPFGRPPGAGGAPP